MRNWFRTQEQSDQWKRTDVGGSDPDEAKCVLCSSCRVRPLSESINDLFREVSQLHRRISELSHRLAILEPYLRRHGYRGEDGEEAGGSRAQKGEGVSLARYALKNKDRASGPRASRVVRRRRVRILKNRGAASEWLKWIEREDVLRNKWKSIEDTINPHEQSKQKLWASCENNGLAVGLISKTWSVCKFEMF